MIIDIKYCWFWNHRYSKSFHKNKNWFQPIVSSAQIQQKLFEMQKTLQFYPIICTKKQSFKIRFCQKYQKRRSLLPISASNSLCLSPVTLFFYNNKPSKTKHFLILLSSLARNWQEPKLKRIFEIPWVLFEKILSLYFDWPKSWIWRTLEKVMNIFSKWHFHNASKEVFWPKKILNFMHGFKSAILAIFPFCQNGTFESELFPGSVKSRI